jgi:hypothetical protein
MKTSPHLLAGYLTGNHRPALELQPRAWFQTSSLFDGYLMNTPFLTMSPADRHRP